MLPEQQIVGIGEIAELYGVSIPAVRKWRLDPDWPDPEAVIGKQLVWSRAAVAAWVAISRPSRAGADAAA